REAGDIVGRKLLQAEADADAQRAAENRQQREIEADRLQRDQHGDHQKNRAHELAEDDAEVRIDLRRAVQALLDDSRDPQRDDQREDDDQHGGADRQQRDVRLAERNLNVVERGGDFRKQSEK